VVRDHAGTQSERLSESASVDDWRLEAAKANGGAVSTRAPPLDQAWADLRRDEEVGELGEEDDRGGEDSDGCDEGLVGLERLGVPG
jgi:hypothetical protein